MSCGAAGGAGSPPGMAQLRSRQKSLRTPKSLPCRERGPARGGEQGLPRQLTEHLREPTVFLHSLLCKNKVNNSCNLGNKMEKA